MVGVTPGRTPRPAHGRTHTPHWTCQGKGGRYGEMEAMEQEGVNIDITLAEIGRVIWEEKEAGNKPRGRKKMMGH